MNITKSNFYQTLPFVLECLKKSHFAAIDYEMTGITAHPNIQMRYWKVKENVKRFLPIQMGLCFFEVVSPEKVIAYPFNFYILPLSLENIVDKSFICQTSTMNFLAQYDFDFNKLFYDGVYYLSREGMENLEKNQRTLMMKKELHKLNKIVQPEMIAFADLYMPKVEKFIQDAEATQTEIEIRFIKFRVYKYLEEKVQATFPHVALEFDYDSETIFRRSKLIIRKKPKEEIKPDEVAPKQETVDEIDLFGFRKIIDYLSAHQIPLIVHNGMLDIMHLFDKFFYTLPETHKEFKMGFKKAFPLLYDTKYMLSNSNVLWNAVGNATDLTSAFLALKVYSENSPLVELAEDFQEYTLKVVDKDSAASHEAGFDALITGYIFFKALGILHLAPHLKDPSFVEKMKFFENRIPLGGMRIPFNLNFEEDPTKDNTIVFYLENKDRLLKMEQIKDYFEKNHGNVNLYPLYGDNIDYFAIFQKRDDGMKFREVLAKKEGENIVRVGEGESSASLFVKTYEKYEEKVRNDIKRHLYGVDMPEILNIVA